MKCPRCSESLIIKEHEGHIGYRCDDCEGIFLPQKYISSLEKNYGEKAAQLSNFLSKKNGNLTALKCSECFSHLYSILTNDIEIDHCKKCNGIWFDKDELRKLVTNRKSLEEEGVWLSGILDIVFGVASSF